MPFRSHTSWRSESQDPPVRTLPIRLDPLPEGSLDSWLEALARRRATAWGDTLSAVGLTDPIGEATNDPAPPSMLARVDVATYQQARSGDRHRTGCVANILGLMGLRR